MGFSIQHLIELYIYVFGFMKKKKIKLKIQHTR